MLRLVDCLTLEHDLDLVLLAAMICLLGCAASVVVAERAMNGLRPRVWVSLLSLCAASTAWSTHFIGMLAYQTSVPITYDFVLTALSLLVGIIMLSLGFWSAFRWRAYRAMRLAGGAIVGGGVGALHFIGMAGLRFPGVVNYDANYVAFSLLLAILLGSAATESLFAESRRKMKLLAGALMLLMIVSLHFVGMSAASLELGFFDAEGGVSRSFLTIAVTLTSLVVLTVGMVAAIFDQRISLQLATQAERFRMLADGAFEGLIVHREQQILDTNLAARDMLGSDREYLGRNLADWSIPVGTALQLGDAAIVQEVQVSCENGRSFPAEICRRAIRLQSGEVGEMIAMRDLTQRKAGEARIAHLALHDPLTDLPNRRFFNEWVNEMIVSTGHSGGQFALLVMDLDNFKSVNDMHGHVVGDELIKLVALRIGGLLREGDVVSRQGGDEFAILCASDDQLEQVIALAQDIHDIFQSSIALNGAQLMLGASIGVAVYPDDGDSLEELMRNADTAMYESKAEGKATTRFFESRMNVQLEARRTLESRLRLALELDALSLHYQPQVCCSDRSAVCFEALLRWTDAELGSVSPVDFIPVAEQTGLIVAIGEFVLRQACKDAACWPDSIRVAVNLSVAQFGKQNIVGIVKDALQTNGLNGDRLELEITESLLIENKEEALQTLEELKALGIHIAMDDFGTGYSSLSYLQSFNFNKIKIDRTFVSNLEKNPDSTGIVEAVVSMGKSLHMKVVAEGVETIEQASILSGLDCDELQGFLISRPMPAIEVQAFLEKQTRDSQNGSDAVSVAA